VEGLDAFAEIIRTAQAAIGLAFELVMRSRRVSAWQAYEWGIATECVPDGEFEAATDALAAAREILPIARTTTMRT
jgi:enoyl-CoA hydratase/carnithine racemase